MRFGGDLMRGRDQNMWFYGVFHMDVIVSFGSSFSQHQVGLKFLTASQVENPGTGILSRNKRRSEVRHCYEHTIHRNEKNTLGWMISR